MSLTGGSPDLALLAVSRALALDAVACEVATALEDAGIASILIKGPTLAEWLYPDGAVRPYGDVDLLVGPADLQRAEAVLVKLGFDGSPGAAPLPTPHARAWHRGSDGAIIDLHWTVSGSCVGPAETWQVLRAGATSAKLGGGEVQVLGHPARALMVALHAAQHGYGQPIEDLRRAIEHVPWPTWRAAAELADRLHAGYGFGAGLRLLPAGAALADRLGLVGPALLRAGGDDSHAQLVLGFERLTRTPGWPAKLRLLARELAPSPSFMRWRLSIARRGPAGLALAYAWRPLWLGWHLAPSLRAWRRARAADARLPDHVPRP